MAIVTHPFDGDGTTKNFTVSSTILSKSHVRVDLFYDSVDHEIPASDWDILSATVVFKTAPASGQVVKVTVSDDGSGLDTAPSDISDLAVLVTELGVLAGIADEMVSLYTDKATLDSLYADKATLDSLFADKAKLDSLFSDKTTLDSLYEDKTTLDALFADLANINSVGSNIVKVINASDNIDDIANYADTYYGSKATEPTTRNDSSPIQTGDMYFDTTTGYMRVYIGTAWSDAFSGDFYSRADSDILHRSVPVKVKATEAISKGDVVKATGYNSGEDAIECKKTVLQTDIAIGIAREDIANGEFGDIVSRGIVEGLDTSAFSFGDILYSNGSAGFTTTPPTSLHQAVGYVVKNHAVTGAIMVDFTEPHVDAYSKTESDSMQNHIPISKVLAGLLSVTNVVSIEASADPFADSSQKIKFRLNGDITETSGNVTSISQSGLTYDFEGQKWGTAQGVFDGTAYITGTSAINSNTFSYNFVITPTIVESGGDDILLDFTTGRGTVINGTASNKNLSYFDGTGYTDLGYKLTVGKQETIGITVNGTTLKLYVNGLLHSTHTVTSSAIDGIFIIGSNLSGTGNFTSCKLDQLEVYLGEKTATEMEALHFQEITRTDNEVTTTGLKVGYANGYGDNGAIKTSESFTDGSKTLVGLTTSSMNYPYTTEGDVANINFTTVEPVFGTNNKRTSAVNPDVFVDGKWYDSVNGTELVTNGTDLVDTTGWTAGEVSGGTASTLSVVNGNLRVTSTGATNGTGEQILTLVVGERYRFKVKGLLGTSAYWALRLGTTLHGTEIYNSDAIESDKEIFFDFYATTTSLYVTLLNSSVSDSYNDFGNISSFLTNIEPDTAYTTPRTYLPNIVETDSANKPALLHEWQPATLVEKYGVFDKLALNGSPIASTEGAVLWSGSAGISTISVDDMSEYETIYLELYYASSGRYNLHAIPYNMFKDGKEYRIFFGSSTVDIVAVLRYNSDFSVSVVSAIACTLTTIYGQGKK